MPQVAVGNITVTLKFIKLQSKEYQRTKNRGIHAEQRHFICEDSALEYSLQLWIANKY